MIYGLLVVMYVLIAFLCILLVLVQKGKGNMGLGAFGGSSQMLFGGAGGQDILQKITWVLTVLLMSGSLALSLMRSHSSRTSRYLQSSTQSPSLPKT